VQGGAQGQAADEIPRALPPGKGLPMAGRRGRRRQRPPEPRHGRVAEQGERKSGGEDKGKTRSDLPLHPCELCVLVPALAFHCWA
jgi:hypothetical protein